MGYAAFDPKCQVKGSAMTGFLENIRRESILPYLEKHGLTDIDPEAWYPHQPFLDLMTDLAHNREAMFDLVAVGMRMAENAPFPPEVDSIEKALLGFSEAHYVVYRGGDSGIVTAEKLSDRHIRLAFRTPQTDESGYGVTYGVARRFATNEDDLVVEATVEGSPIGGMRVPVKDGPPLILDVYW